MKSFAIKDMFENTKDFYRDIVEKEGIVFNASGYKEFCKELAIWDPRAIGGKFSSSKSWAEAKILSFAIHSKRHKNTKIRLEFGAAFYYFEIITSKSFNAKREAKKIF